MRSPHAGRLGVRRTLSAGREGRRGERTSGAAVARPPGRPAPQVWSAARQIVPAPTLAPLKPELQDKKQAPGGRQVRNSAGTPVSWLAYTGQGPSSPWGYRTRPRRRSRPGRCRRAGEYVFWKVGDNVTHAPSSRPSGTRWMACKPPGAANVCVAHFAESSPAALEVAFTVGRDRAPAHGSAAPAMASSNTRVPPSATGLGRMARREAYCAPCGVRPPPGSQM